MAKAQVTIEYLILTGFVLLVIIIPLTIFVFSSTSRGVNSEIVRQQTKEIGNNMVLDAKQVYYLGLYSKKNAIYKIPLNVEKMFIVDLEKQGNHSYYLIIRLSDGKEEQTYYFDSEVPLMSDYDNEQVDSQGDFGDLAECSNYNCRFYNFIGDSIKPGNKKFLFETRVESGKVKVSITPVK